MEKESKREGIKGEEGNQAKRMNLRERREEEKRAGEGRGLARGRKRGGLHEVSSGLG